VIEMEFEIRFVDQAVSEDVLELIPPRVFQIVLLYIY